MNSKSQLTMDYKTVAGNIASWIFGIAVFAVGIINTFWGNDTGFGIFLVLLSFMYFPPVQTIIKNMLGITIPLIIKILAGAFVIWAAMGVGELPSKISLMIRDLS